MPKFDGEVESMSVTELREIQDFIDSGDYGVAAELCEAHGIDFDDVEAALASLDNFSDDEEVDA